MDIYVPNSEQQSRNQEEEKNAQKCNAMHDPKP